MNSEGQFTVGQVDAKNIQPQTHIEVAQEDIVTTDGFGKPVAIINQGEEVLVKSTLATEEQQDNKSKPVFTKDIQPIGKAGGDELSRDK